MDEELQALEAELAQLRAAVNAPATPTATPNMRPAVATGGLLNLGDILTFGQLSKGIAAVPAIGRDLYGLATGAEPQDYYSQELAKVNALKDLYAAERDRQSLSGLETALSFMAPVPAGKAEALMSVARPLKEAGLGLAAYGGSELGEATIGGTGGAITGALAAPSLLSLGKAGMRAIAPSLEEGGKGLQRTSLGIRQSDYTKTARNQIIESLPGDFETTLKNSADRLVENKTLGTSTNPDVLYSNLRDAKESTEGAIQGVLQEVDKTRKTGIIPRLDKTLEWIQTKAPATEVKYYKEKVNEFLKALKEQGQGSLVYLNQQKKAIGENWKQSPETDPTFWRRFYTDVKDTIEEYAPQVKQLNKDKRDLLVIEPVLERVKRASETPLTPQKLAAALFYTTGQLGLPGAAMLTGSPVLGTALAGGLALAGTKPGQSLLGRSLTATGRAGQALEPSLLQTTPRTIREATSEMLSKEQFIAQQSYLHGTSEAGLKAIEEAKAFIPKTINYSVLGEGTVYGAKQNSWWFDPEKAAAGRMWELPNKVPMYVKPEANITKINNDKDWEKLASKLNMTGEELASALYFEPGASKAKVQQAKVVKQKLIDSGVDAIEIGKQPDWIKSKAVQELESKYIDIYYKFLQKGDTVFNDANIVKRLPVALLDKLKGLTGFKKYEFGDDQLAIINHKVAEPAEYAYERLLKNDPSKLMKMTPQERELLPPAIKEQASRLGYFGARGAQQAGEQAPVSPAAIPTATPTEDTEIADLESELESLRQMLPKQEAKVGKQDISIPTGKQYAPASLVKAVMKVESGGKQEAVSSKGARGLMQLMPATARDLGVDAKDPKQNVEGGSRYLAQQLSEFGDESLALAAYNWGPNNIKRAMAKVRAEGKRPTWANIKAYVKVPKETREYVDKVLSLI
jgi:hypothetical protein